MVNRESDNGSFTVEDALQSPLSIRFSLYCSLVSSTLTKFSEYCRKWKFTKVKEKAFFRSVWFVG